MKIITFPNSPEKAIFKLLCLPYAGGSPSVFCEWNRCLGTHIEVISVEYPGRGSQYNTEPPANIRQMAKLLASALIQQVDSPYAVYGHSMGALLGYELCVELQRKGYPLPKVLFAAAHRSPQMPYPGTVLHNLEKCEFIKELKRLNGTPAEVFENAELLDYHLPLIKADFEACETYQYRETELLHTEIVGIRGNTDDQVSLNEMKNWRDLTQKDFQLIEIPGNHFFVQSASDHLWDIISKRLQVPLECQQQSV